MEITSEIFQVGGGGYTSNEDAAIYLLNLDGNIVLIDAGCGNEFQRLINNIQTIGIKPELISYLLLTHCHYDHTGGASRIRQAFNCQVVIHELDAPFVKSGDNKVTAAEWYGARMEPVYVDRRLSKPVETIELGSRFIQAHHLPGHSPGSVAYLVESDGLKVVFGQDVHGPIHPSLKSCQTDYQESLKKLVELQPDILCEGHYGVFHGRSEAIQFIRSFII